MDADQSAVEGTGLGLALSHCLAELTGGTVGVESELDRGSTFWVELPLIAYHREPAPSVAAPGTDTLAETAAEGFVLYIEDNLSNVRLMERILPQRPGLELGHAPDGDSGFAIIAERRPDLVLLDLHLPKVSGEDVLRHIWQNPLTRGISTVIVTADATPGLDRQLKAAGASAVLTRPLDVKQVLHTVDDLLSAQQESPADA